MLLTVIIPFKDRAEEVSERFFELYPLKNQIQLLLIDDGSSTETRTSLMEKNVYNCVEVKLQRNLGRMNAIREAIPFIRGEFVCIADSDDPILIANFKTLITIILPRCKIKKIQRIIAEPSEIHSLDLKKNHNIFRFWENTKFLENKEILHKEIFVKSFKDINSKSHRIPTKSLWCLAYAHNEFYTIGLKLVEKSYLDSGISKNILKHKLTSSKAMAELYQLLIINDKNASFWNKLIYHVKYNVYRIFSSLT